MKLLKLLKLLRLIKIPNLFKLFDSRKLKTVVKAATGPAVSEKKFEYEHILMYIYKILQIFAMAIFLMYVSGCAFFFNATVIYDSLDDNDR